MRLRSVVSATGNGAQEADTNAHREKPPQAQIHEKVGGRYHANSIALCQGATTLPFET